MGVSGRRRRAVWRWQRLVASIAGASTASIGLAVVCGSLTCALVETELLRGAVFGVALYVGAGVLVARRPDT